MRLSIEPGQPVLRQHLARLNIRPDRPPCQYAQLCLFDIVLDLRASTYRFPRTLPEVTTTRRREFGTRSKTGLPRSAAVSLGHPTWFLSRIYGCLSPLSGHRPQACGRICPLVRSDQDRLQIVLAYGTTARHDGTARRHGTTARHDGTARRHGTTARHDGTARRHGTTARHDGTARRQKIKVRGTLFVHLTPGPAPVLASDSRTPWLHGPWLHGTNKPESPAGELTLHVGSYIVRLGYLEWGSSGKPR